MLCTREVTVQVPDGLHHQTAARFIQTANRFTCLLYTSPSPRDS